jgi:hypothetical protein
MSGVGIHRGTHTAAHIFDAAELFAMRLPSEQPETVVLGTARPGGRTGRWDHSPPQTDVYVATGTVPAGADSRERGPRKAMSAGPSGGESARVLP